MYILNIEYSIKPDADAVMSKPLEEIGADVVIQAVRTVLNGILMP